MQKKERKKPSDITVANKTDAVWSEPCWKHVFFFFFLIEKCIYLIPECYTGAPFMWWCHCRENNS